MFYSFLLFGFRSVFVPFSFHLRSRLFRFRSSMEALFDVSCMLGVSLVVSASGAVIPWPKSGPIVDVGLAWFF